MKKQFIFTHNNLVLGNEEFNLESRGMAINKPFNAVWSSSLINFRGNLPETSWSEWCEYECYGDINSSSVYEIVFRLEPKILTIKSLSDFKYLRGLLFHDKEFSIHENDFAINFNKAKEVGFDGINLTEDALIESKMFRYNDQLNICFDAWDCESTVWLNSNTFKEYRYLGKYNELLK